MKRRAVFGQWKTPPQVLYPSSSSGMKKSASTPVFPSGLHSAISPISSSNGVHPSELQNAEQFKAEQGQPMHSGQPYANEEANMLDFPSSGYHPRRQLHNHGQMQAEDLGLNEFVDSAAGGMPMYDDLGMKSEPLFAGDMPMMSDDHLGGHGHVGFKRTAHGISRQKSEGSASLRRSLLRGDNPTLSSDDMMMNSFHSCPDLANLKNFGSETNLAELQDQAGDDQATRKQKRLARNRAAARIRRQRRKTIVDTLERELIDLNRSIVFLRNIDKQKKGAGPGILSIPMSTVKKAHETANAIQVKIQNGSVTTTSTTFDPLSSPKKSVSVLKKASSKMKKGGQEDDDELMADEEDNSQQGNAPVPPRQIQDADDARKVLLEYLIGNAQESTSLSKSRRRASIQLFLDAQINASHKLVCEGLSNSALSSVLFDGHYAENGNSVSSTAELLKAMKLSLTHHVAGSPASQKENELAGKPLMPSAVELNATKPTPSAPPDLSVPGTVTRKGVIPTKNACGNLSAPETKLKSNKTAVKKLATELSQILKLSDGQKSQLRQLSHGLQREQIRLQALQRIAVSFACHGWLEYDTVDRAHTQFHGLLNDKQMRFFHNFILKNQATIENLKLEVENPPVGT